jgi:hypothetical protein
MVGLLGGSARSSFVSKLIHSTKLLKSSTKTRTEMEQPSLQTRAARQENSKMRLMWGKLESMCLFQYLCPCFRSRARVGLFKEMSTFMGNLVYRYEIFSLSTLHRSIHSLPFPPSLSLSLSLSFFLSLSLSLSWN